MVIRLLDQTDIEATKDLFLVPSYMGTDIDKCRFYVSEKYSQFYHETFCCSYLSGLNNYKSIGYFEENNLLGFLSYYISNDDPSWYGTQIRSTGGKEVVRTLLDYAIKNNEDEGRFKFYTLWSKEHARLLRRFAFSDYNKKRYDYFDEYIVPKLHKPFYTSHWHVLFNRVLLPIDTVVRCSYLKKEYRNNLPIGANI